MDTTTYLGLFIWIWLLSGFIVGVFALSSSFTRKKFNTKMNEIRREYVRDDLTEKIFNMFASSRLSFLAFFTLMGFIDLIVYLNDSDNG